MMITLDPDTAEKSPAVLKAVAQAHEGWPAFTAPSWLREQSTKAIR